MSETSGVAMPVPHSHVFLSGDHQRSERKTWAVIWLCSAMMVAEIVGGWLFGSIALVADGLHMSTHAGALLLAALAYTYARKYAEDPRFPSNRLSVIWTCLEYMTATPAPLWWNVLRW